METFQAMETYNTGDILIPEGSNDKDVFILYKGELGVFKGDLMLTTINKKVQL